MDFPIIPRMGTRARISVAAINTLVLSTLLHAFTHAFAAMLVPLYLLMQADLGLKGVQPAAMIVTVYGTVYMILSYPAGVLADRVSRKRMLGAGLILNAVAIVLMGLTRRYDVLVSAGSLGGNRGDRLSPGGQCPGAGTFSQITRHGDRTARHRLRPGIFCRPAVCRLARRDRALAVAFRRQLAKAVHRIGIGGIGGWRALSFLPRGKQGCR